MDRQSGVKAGGPSRWRKLMSNFFTATRGQTSTPPQWSPTLLHPALFHARQSSSTPIRTIFNRLRRVSNRRQNQDNGLRGRDTVSTMAEGVMNSFDTVSNRELSKAPSSDEIGDHQTEVRTYFPFPAQRASFLLSEATSLAQTQPQN